MAFGERARAAVRAVLGSDMTTVEAAGLTNAVAAISVSFDRGLLPRTTPQQAVLTGLWGVSTYGMTVTAQSIIEAVARRVGFEKLDSPEARRTAIMATDALAIGFGLALQKGLPAKPDEPLLRAAGRAIGWRSTLSGVSGLLALVADGVHDAITHTHEEQSVNAVATVLSGTVVAGGMYLWRQRRLIDTGVERDAFGGDVGAEVKSQPVRATVVGVGVSTALLLTSRGERALAHTIGRGVAYVAPGVAPYANTFGHAAALAGGLYAAFRGIDAIFRKTEEAGIAVEAAYSTRPTSPYVSGGDRTEEDWSTFGREGRRYVNMALTAQDVEQVTGRPAMDPIRGYVGLGTDISPQRRAARAMRELELMNAFDREYIAVWFPTGTGYVNYVACEALEYFTDGNVASIAIQYSVRPSFLSLGEVGTAKESNQLLLNRIAERLESMPQERRPKVLLFGESLGSLGGQDVLDPESTGDLDLLKVHGALFIGTPYASKWRQRWLATPDKVDPDGIVVEVSGIDAFNSLPESRRAQVRVVLLTHDNDPIPKFGAPLIIQEPDWLRPGGNRPAGVPREAVFVPGLTFMATAVDLLNADHVVPGTFEAYAHDYRADLAQMVAASYRLEVSAETMASVEAALRQRELVWAERRLASEKLQQAEDQIRKTISGWGIDSSSVPSFVEPNRDIAPDPYAAIPKA